MNSFINESIPGVVKSLDAKFRPAALANKKFLEAVKKSGKGTGLAVALERNGGFIANYKTQVFAEGAGMDEDNFIYVERLVKSLIWIKGGWKLTIGGPRSIGEYIRKAYAQGGLREFDVNFMQKIYEKPFTVVVTDLADVPEEYEDTKPVGRHLDGCRIGFDAGGSDRKVSAVIDGEAVFSEEVVWHPKIQADPDYHYQGILSSMKTAAAHMPRVDAIGVSSAGVYVENRIMAASLFIKIPQELFDEKVKNMFFRIQKEMGNVPLEVANDGDVTALAGAMDLKDTNVLGIAMGTSEAGGYIDGLGNITGWLNELAFVPADYNPGSAVDEWAGDYGCGVKYFSQDAVIKLAPLAGIELDEKSTPAEKLKAVQELHEKGSQGAAAIFETIGCYLGYAIAHYSDFYDIKHILILGRVTSGDGGNIIQKTAEDILVKDFPELAKKIKLHLPDESNRRVGQSIAAASLPKI